MSRLLINDASRADQLFIGTNPNDQTGDSLRIAAQKLAQWATDLNTMTAELYGANRVFVTASTNIDTLQAIHDALKTAGGGTIIFTDGATYTPTTTVTIDTGFVGIDFGWSKIDISSIAAGSAWLTVTATQGFFTSTNKSVPNRKIERGWITGPNNNGDASGPTAIYLNVTTANVTNRLILSQLRIEHCYKALEFGSGSPFVRGDDLFVQLNVYGIHQDASATNSFAEKVTFDRCVFGNNDYHLNDLSGNIWTFQACSFDYHVQRCFQIANGAKLTMTNCHCEWNYGQGVSDTNEPFKLTGVNTSWFMRGGTLYYTGIGQNPTYASHAITDSSTNWIDLHPDRVVQLGRLSNTTALDSFCLTAAAGSAGRYNLEFRPGFTSPNNFPSMTAYTDMIGGSGVGGILNNGVSNPYNELAHRIALTGTAAIANISADENGVTRKNGANMLKITGSGKVLINLPRFMPMRRHVWSLFTNPAFLTGTVTIKERQTTYGTKFDGTSTVSFAGDTRGASYSPTTVTISAGANAWTRTSWKDTNTSSSMSNTQNMDDCIQIEIDATSMSAGALYISHCAFDLM